MTVRTIRTAVLVVAAAIVGAALLPFVAHVAVGITLVSLGVGIVLLAPIVLVVGAVWHLVRRHPLGDVAAGWWIGRHGRRRSR